jgi:hypothetical protein
MSRKYMRIALKASPDCPEETIIKILNLDHYKRAKKVMSNCQVS